MEKQISNKKFKTTVLSLCLGFLMVVGAVIGVWAASTQNYKAGFNVSYSVGDNVAAKVRTEYYVPNQDSDSDGKEDGAVAVTTNEEGETVTDEKGYVTFNAGDGNEDGSEVYIGNFKLSPQTPKAVFYFTIHNILDEGYVMVAPLPTITQKQNMKFRMKYYNTTSFSEATSASTLSDDLFTNKQYENASAQGYKIVKIEVEVLNKNASATIAGDIGFDLYYQDEAQSISTLDRTKFHSYFVDEGLVEYEWGYVSATFDYAQKYPTFTTGVDLSEAGDGSIWAYNDGEMVYILSNKTIALPANCDNLFNCYTPMVYYIEATLFNADVSFVTNPGSMFDGLSALRNLYCWDTSSWTDMSCIFCDNYTLTDFTILDTSNVTNMSWMFNGCYTYSWEEGDFIVFDLSTFDTRNVTNYQGMFDNSYFSGEYNFKILVGENWTLDMSDADYVGAEVTVVRI